jgi:hypothetical protein
MRRFLLSLIFLAITSNLFAARQLKTYTEVGVLQEATTSYGNVTYYLSVRVDSLVPGEYYYQYILLFELADEADFTLNELQELLGKKVMLTGRYMKFPDHEPWFRIASIRQIY